MVRTFSLSHGRVAYVSMGRSDGQANVCQSTLILTDLRSSSIKMMEGTLVSSVRAPTWMTTDALLLKRYSVCKA